MRDTGRRVEEKQSEREREREKSGIKWSCMHRRHHFFFSPSHLFIFRSLSLSLSLLPVRDVELSISWWYKLCVFWDKKYSFCFCLFIFLSLSLLDFSFFSILFNLGNKKEERTWKRRREKEGSCRFGLPCFCTAQLVGIGALLLS